MTQQEITRAYAEMEKMIQNSRSIPTIGQLYKQLDELLFNGISDYVEYTVPSVFIRSVYRQSASGGGIYKTFEREVWRAEIAFNYGAPSGGMDKTIEFSVEAISMELLYVQIDEKFRAFVDEIQTNYSQCQLKSANT